MVSSMKYGDDYKFLPVTSKENGKGIEVLPDLYQYTVQIVNVIFYGNPYDNQFVLIDAGMPKSSEKIIEAAITGHGQPMIGQKLKDELSKLANNFDEIAKPDSGKYTE